MDYRTKVLNIIREERLSVAQDGKETKDDIKKNVCMICLIRLTTIEAKVTQLKHEPLKELIMKVLKVFNIT